MKWVIVGTVLVLVVLLTVPWRGIESGRVEPIGNFAIVTRDVGYLAGWNEGRVERRTTQAYSIRYRDRPFEIEGLGGMMGDETRRYRSVNAVVTFQAAVPALIVNVGDPNNLNFHYLLREADGEPKVRLLAGNSGFTEARLADVPDGGFEYLDLSQHRIHVSGGRWMLLSGYRVFDTQTLEAFEIEPTAGSGVTMYEPLLMSPDKRSIVRRGGRYPDLVVVVCDFRTPRTYWHDVDRSRMRYQDAETVDAAWIDHHYAWESDEDGVDRLVPRTDFTPLPHRGVLRPPMSEHDSSMYSIEHVGKAMQERLVDFIVSELGGTRGEERGDLIPVALDDVELSVAQRESYVSLSAGFMQITDRIDEIAARFDALLATGELDALFLGADSP